MRKRKPKPKPPPLGINGLAPHDQRKLMEIVTRIERLRDERSAISDAIADVFAEAREWNFHLPTIRRAVRDRALPVDKRQMAEDLLDSYRHALGMLADTPLGRAALERDGDPVPAPRTTRRSKGGDHVSAESTVAATPAAPAAAPCPDPELAGETVDDMRALRAGIEGKTT